MKRVCLYCVLLWAAVACAPGDNKYSERDFVGIWVEPVPGMAGVQGIALEEDGAAHSVNMATLRYETWKYEKGSVKQAELLGAAFTLAAGGQAEVHVGTSGGGVSSELPWNDKKSKGLKR